MYVVDSSARKATITLTGEEVAVKFPCTYSVFGIKGDSMLLYPKSGMTQGNDGVYDTAEGDGSVIMCLHYQADTVYIKGTGSCVIWAGNSTLDNPFKVGGKGGDDGGTLRMLGATTTPLSDGATTNPITIDGQSVTVEKNDVAIYNTREFYFSGTTWSEFGGQMDTVPTKDSANAVTSDGVWKYTPLRRTGANFSSAVGGYSSQVLHSAYAIAFGDLVDASGNASAAFGHGTHASEACMTAVGKYNNPRTGDLFNVGNGSNSNNRSNIIEANGTSLNVNGDIQKNGVSLPTPYTTMPTITSDMLGQIAMYVGTTDANYTQGWFYIASSDGAAEPTYSWQALMDSVPKSGSNNPVTSDGVYQACKFVASSGTNSIIRKGVSAYATGARAIGLGYASQAFSADVTVIGRYNNSVNNDLFEIGNGTSSNRSNIVEVNSTQMNVNGDIKRDGVGIDDYTTTERKIGKWIDGSDLYQRTFEVTGLTNDGVWNQSVLGTSDIDIVDWIGYLEYEDGNHVKQRYPINFKSGEYDGCCISVVSDLTLMAKITPLTLIKAVITIKYTKPSAQANTLNANIQQTEEPTDEMR